MGKSRLRLNSNKMKWLLIHILADSRNAASLFINGIAVEKEMKHNLEVFPKSHLLLEKQLETGRRASAPLTLLCQL